MEDTNDAERSFSLMGIKAYGASSYSEYCGRNKNYNWEAKRELFKKLLVAAKENQQP